MRNFTLFDLSKSFYDRRQKELHDRELFGELMSLSKVQDHDLEPAGVSKREFDQIKLLWALDPHLFKPSELGSFSPYSQIIDISKYGDKIPKDVKEILYRPPKVKNLYEKYW